ncbi:MAG: exodeoxyribonuclease III [bacterium]|nr:exodeoxyribonuclease III [bacterium]
MKNLKILSWNVNGIRAAERKGFLEWLRKEQPDILCLQETKAEKEQLSEELLKPEGYLTYWSNSKRKKGYSGTAIYTKFQPGKIHSGLGDGKFDQEGRTIVAEFGELILFNIYFPNGKQNAERLKFKMDFYEAFQQRVEKEVRNGKKVLICGDINTAHHPIDLARPKENEDISGFLPMEREWMDRFEAAGFYDTFRLFHPDEADQYTWWSMRSGARERNVGWRIDYFYCSENLKAQVKDAFILPDVLGSDHCPIGVEFEVSKNILKNENIIDEHELSGDSHLQPTLV